MTRATLKLSTILPAIALLLLMTPRQLPVAAACADTPAVNGPSAVIRTRQLTTTDESTKGRLPSEGRSNSVAEQLPAAAEKANVAIDRRSIVSATGERISLVTALVVAPKKLDRAALEKGANLSFVHVSSPSGKLPSGYYKLKVSKGRSREWQTSLVNLEGKEAVSFPSDVRVAEAGGGTPAGIRIFIDGIEWGSFGSMEFMLRVLRRLGDVEIYGG